MARHLGFMAQFALMQFVSVVMTLDHLGLGYLSQKDPQQHQTHPCMVAAQKKLCSKENKKKIFTSLYIKPCAVYSRQCYRVFCQQTK